VQSHVAEIARDEAPTLARALRQALHLSNDEQEHTRRTLADTGWLLSEKTVTVAALKRIIAAQHFPMVQSLLAAIAAARLYVDKIESLQQLIAEAKQTEIAPEPLLTGEDLIVMGLQPGKLFKIVLDKVYDAQLEGRIRTKENAIEFRSVSDEVDSFDISPSGRRAAISVKGQLLTIATDRGDITRVNPDAMASRSQNPKWSPDGKYIAYVSDKSGQDEIWISDPEGKSPKKITTLDNEKNPAIWSPDVSAASMAGCSLSTRRNSTPSSFLAVVGFAMRD